ncbi:MAG: flavodoxin family protein [Bacteroidales bacterium]|jgi:multimeric flavodoxin WrbA|nr:flavodoxin family protein [Bacteroidales bacterium]
MEEVRVIGINGSPRKDGNTAILVREVLGTLSGAGISTEFYQLGGADVNGCDACMLCKKKKDGFCHRENDVLNDLIGRMMKADGIIIGSPVYFSDVTPEVKALIDVAGYAGRAAGNIYRRKVGAAVVAVRRAGAIHTFDSINHFFLINEMIVPGSSYWNIGIGREKGDVINDEEGIRTMRTLGENMAWVIKGLPPAGR